MFFHILKQSFFRGRRRKTLAVVTIVFAASLITALMNISIDVGDKMAQELKTYGANINIVPKSENIPLEIGGIDYNPLKGQVFLEEKNLPGIKDIFWRNNIIGFAPFLKVMVETEGKKQNHIPMIGTYFDKHLAIPDEEDFHTGVRVVYPYWQVSGDWPEDEEPSGVLAGALLARRTGWKVGDHVTVSAVGENKNAVLVIRGILYTGGPEENRIIAPLPVVHRLTGLYGKLQSISVSALTVPENTLSRRARRDPDSLSTEEWDIWYCIAYVSSISHQLEEAIPNASARPIWQVAASEGAIIHKIQLLILVVTIAAFITSGLGISSLMNVTIMERSREIGLMKALGAADWEVYLLFQSEAVVVGVIGGVLGFMTGTGLSQVIGLSIFGSTVSFNPIVIPVAIGISALIALVGSLMPSRLITRLYPAEVLHGRR
jgi:putative ABC transport system permease protein